MKKLLSLPPNLVECFHDIEKASPEQWYCTSDPVDKKLGSGGGSSWLLRSCMNNEDPTADFATWLSREKRILLHAGGQSRRLPSYAPSGKILTPIPVFRWARGQKLSQNLLSLQMPLYEEILSKAPSSLHTLIASGDVYIRVNQPLKDIPQADVVCYGIWADPELATNHGVFLASRDCPGKLDFMAQKPSIQQIATFMQTHYCLMDIGVWLLSDKAVMLLDKRSRIQHQQFFTLHSSLFTYYDLYSEFGLALGEHPTLHDEEVANLSVAIIPLDGGEFYHYGTTPELISSTLAVQNLVSDQRAIMHRKVKPHPAMFVQNADVAYQLTSDNSETWIENSCVGRSWALSRKNVITGVPRNDWSLHLPEGVCVDVVPFGENDYVARPYGFNDAFRGDLSDIATLFMGKPFTQWVSARGINIEEISGNTDLQSASLFPVSDNVDDLGKLLRWMISEPDLPDGKRLWLNSQKLSADMISAGANLRRLTSQREAYRLSNWSLLAQNHEHSVFYQIDLEDAAHDFARANIPLPAPLPESSPLMKKVSDAMFRARVLQLAHEHNVAATPNVGAMACPRPNVGAGLAPAREETAFSLMRDGLTAEALTKKQQPRMTVYSDQIVWGRSPVRIDIAGGWTDTPPYCLLEGGCVVNVAIDLNGQQPIQAYVKPRLEPDIVLRSIDLGAVETVSTFQQLSDFMHVGSPFSIPKAALVLAGFHPGFSSERYFSLRQQLQAFGCGIEITLLSAVPAGSGLGTSSILASTVLGAVSDFCGLGWDKNEICDRTLILEQLLTTGGGWQDQYGGVLRGVKLLETDSGMCQIPLVRWMPDYLFTGDEYKPCHLLYYTGITRTAKSILSEIVRGMFLNSSERLSILRQMKSHALDMYEAIQREDFSAMGTLVGKTWLQNQALDPGTNPPLVDSIIRQVSDYCLGLKLPGAGGGGFLYMVAKDPEAASRIKSALLQSPPNSRARFIGMSLSDKGLQVSRS